MFRKLLEKLGLKKSVEEPSPVKKVYKPLPKGKVIAKILGGSDVEFMYEDGDEDPGICPVCHNVLKKIPNLDYRMQRRKGDVFYTYDMFCIVTEKFKKFCETNRYEGLKFTVLPKSPGYYYFESEKTFKVDLIKGRSEFGPKRSCCNQYDYITRGHLYKYKNYCLQTDDFICCTDYWFGCYNQKKPTYIVGLKTAGKMRKAGISGIYFDDVME